MRRLSPLALLLILAATVFPLAAFAAPPEPAPASPTASATPRKKSKSPAPGTAAKLLGQGPSSGISKQDLSSPYSAILRKTVRPEPGQTQGAKALEERVQSNATSWKVEPSLRSKQSDQTVQLRLGREKVVDPMTGRELTPRADPMGATKSLKELDIKGAAEKLGGKAEVQVDILKF
jgi:hypothetical protein